MKNYLVKSLFQVSSPNWGFKNRSNEKDLYKNYVAMHQVSLTSAKHFLRGDWEFKFISGRCDNINEAFQKTFWGIKELWDKEPCNILYTDPDVLMIKDVDPWDKYEHFMMFNYTDPKRFRKPNIYNKSFDHFFNAGVRYFPSTMSQDIWNTGVEMAKSWDSSTYDTEQIILNTMLWDQGIALEKALDPAMSWQAFLPPKEGSVWNNCHLNEAKILHFHSSRNAEDRAKTMQGLLKQLEL